MGLGSGPVTGHQLESQSFSKQRKHARLLLGLCGAAMLFHVAAGFAAFSPNGGGTLTDHEINLIVPTENLELAPRVNHWQPGVGQYHIEKSSALYGVLHSAATRAASPPNPGHAIELRPSFEARSVFTSFSDERRPAIALIIDDVGLNSARTRSAINLPVPVTLSFLPYGDNVQALADEARAAGHEIYLHLPMEPEGAQNPGPNALVHELDEREFAARLTTALDSFEGYVGVNNHMGSSLTQDASLMSDVMVQLSSRGVEFVDSLTSQQSVAFAMARASGIDSALRDVFIDHAIEADKISAQLQETIRIARLRGTAIAIAHPHAASLEALEIWLEEMESQGIDVVPVAEIIRRRNSEGAIYAAR